MNARLIFLFLFTIILTSESFALARLGARLKDSVINNEQRVIVTEVFPGSAAERANILVDDILLSLEGRPILSTAEFIRNIKAITDSIPVVIEIERQGVKISKHIPIQIIEGIPIIVKISRNSIWTSVPFTDYYIYTNNELIGTIPPFQSKKLLVYPTENNEYKAHMAFWETKGVWKVDSTTRFSDLARFRVKKGYTTLVTFFHPELNAVIEYEPDAGEVIRLKKAMLDSLELIDYNRISGDSSLAPRWFKTQTEPSLNETLSDDLRGVFWASIVQCPAILRVLALYLILLPIFIIVNFIKNEWGFDPTIPFSNPLYLILFYPGSKILSWIVQLGAYAFTGKGYYLPFEFILFFLISILIAGGIIYTVKPTFEIIRYDKSRFKRWAVFLLLVIEIIGTIFTVFEIFRRVGLRLPIDIEL
jgi:hypothetical protein